MRLGPISIGERDSAGNLNLISWHNWRRNPYWAWLLAWRRLRPGEGRYWLRAFCINDSHQPRLILEFACVRRSLEFQWQRWWLYAKRAA